MHRYVRQRMGRNKLKSFGPLMCRMARLANPRSGSFFFKALGITLLFMAGFPDDLVRKETKYRNLDLLQKYYRYCYCNGSSRKKNIEAFYELSLIIYNYNAALQLWTLFCRTDEDAVGEELFLARSTADSNVRSYPLNSESLNSCSDALILELHHEFKTLTQFVQHRMTNLFRSS